MNPDARKASDDIAAVLSDASWCSSREELLQELLGDDPEAVLEAAGHPLPGSRAYWQPGRWSYVAVMRIARRNGIA